MLFTRILILLSLALAVLPLPGAEADYKPQLRQSLTARPWVGKLPPFADRAAWTELAKLPDMKAILTRASRTVNGRFEPLPDELYMEFFRNGNRTRYQAGAARFFYAAGDFALAYLMTGDERFREKLEEVLLRICEMKSWVLPAHDKGHKVFDGKEMHIDLASSIGSWRCAVIYVLLREKLSPEVAGELKRQLYRRTIDPIRAMFDGRQKPDWWISYRNNWNAVCWTGILGTVLAIEENSEVRIELVNAALRHIGFSLAGFSPDGYCSEGLSYWNYGYGHNLRFALMIREATGGAIDLMKLDAMRRPADYPERLEIAAGVYPAYADCPIDATVDIQMLQMRDTLLGKPLSSPRNLKVGSRVEDLALLLLLPEAVHTAAPVALPPESHFDVAGIAVVRPSAPHTRLAASFKGGSNHELHNHNDVGSYVVVLDGVAMLFDPGIEVYSGRTFSADRYASTLINSKGHPVPVIDGKLQRPGKATDARTVAYRSHADTFHWTLDLAPAYGLPEIVRLERSFDYDRRNAGKVIVTDAAEFSRPVRFETALITPGKFERLSATSARIHYRGHTLNLTVEASAPFEFVQEEIREEVSHKETLTRVAIRLSEPVRSARIAVVAVP